MNDTTLQELQQRLILNEQAFKAYYENNPDYHSRSSAVNNAYFKELCQAERALKSQIEYLKNLIPPVVGDGVTVHLWSDSTAYTVISVSKNGKSFKMQEDNAVLSPDFKPNWVSGGFAGHCTNQDEQSYIYTPNTEEREITVTLRSNGKWAIKGETTRNGQRLTIGMRRKFHDYNF